MLFNMRLEEILDSMEDMLDRTVKLPLSGGKSLVDVDQLREYIEDLRMNLPVQIKDAIAIAANKDEILTEAEQQAEAIIKKAEDRARMLLTKEQVMSQAQVKANELVSVAQDKAKNIRNASQSFAEDIIKQTEDSLLKSLTELRETKQALQNYRRQQINTASHNEQKQ